MSSIIVKPYAKEGWDWMGDDDVKDFIKIDMTGMSSADLWKRIAREYDSNPTQRGQVGIALSNPNPIEEDDREHDEGSVYLDVVSCPPTILSVQTFEEFSAHVFTGVPLVVETEVLFATDAVVTWFADDEVVLHDNKCFTPTEDIIGKEISVLIVPIRPDHDGCGPSGN